MKKLNDNEIDIFAETLSFSKQQAQDIADIFMEIYTKEQGNCKGHKVNNDLENVNDYIKVWQENWHRENSFEEYYNYEKENCISDYDDTSILDNMQNFIEYNKLFGLCYKLKHSEMVIIVC